MNLTTPSDRAARDLIAQRALLERYDKSGPRYTSYPTALHFHEGFGPQDYARHLAAAAQRPDPWAVYVHLPFCRQRCLFCACNVIISPRKAQVADYLDDLRREVAMVAALIPGRRGVSQLHLGGGTPTFFSPEELAGVIDDLLGHFELEPGAEFSVEVDPRVTREAHLEALVARGLNRISLGVQDLDAEVQQAVNRTQSAEQLAALMRASRDLGIGSVNLDLIYGLPRQTPESFARTLDQIVELAPDRLAVYGFAFVPWMKGHQKKLDEAELPDRGLRFELLALARARLAEAGYVDVGMDHFARPEDELALAQRQGRLWRNFMGYTVCRAPDMLGFGISAIGDVQDAFVQNTTKLSRYREAVRAGLLPVERGYALQGDDKLRQVIIRELMCHGLVDKARVEADFAIDFDATFSQEIADLRPEVEEGLVELTDAHIRATDLGRLFLRNLAMPFDRTLSRDPSAGPRYSRTV